MEPNRYLLVSELPGVLEGWYGPVEVLYFVDPEGNSIEREWMPAVVLNGEKRSAALIEHPCLCRDFPPECIRLDLHRPEVQHHLCLTWAPKMDAKLDRWRIEMKKHGYGYEIVSPYGDRLLAGYNLESMEKTGLPWSIQQYWSKKVGNPLDTHDTYSSDLADELRLMGSVEA